MDTNDRIIDILCRAIGVNQAKPADSLEHDLGADSLDKFELVADYEEEFDILISDQEAAQVKTVADLIEFINAKVLAKNP